jgi:hypothetical protein
MTRVVVGGGSSPDGRSTRAIRSVLSTNRASERSSRHTHPISVLSDPSITTYIYHTLLLAQTPVDPRLYQHLERLGLGAESTRRPPKGQKRRKQRVRVDMDKASLCVCGYVYVSCAVVCLF